MIVLNSLPSIEENTGKSMFIPKAPNMAVPKPMLTLSNNRKVDALKMPFSKGYRSIKFTLPFLCKDSFAKFDSLKAV